MFGKKVVFCANGNCDCGCPDAVLSGDKVILTGDPVKGGKRRPRIVMTKAEYEKLLANGHQVLA